MKELPIERGQPWERFAVGKLSSNPRWTETTCQPLEAVFHVAHVEAAPDIVRDGRIRPGLVFDNSKLNQDRILVVWTSPNNWSGAGGFRYGNVSFDFDWKTLVKGLNYYWVESIAYGVSACRILITDQDHGDKPDKLERYDPTLGNGPWWHDTASDQHYWNGSCCLEIMVERELPLSAAMGSILTDTAGRGAATTTERAPTWVRLLRKAVLSSLPALRGGI